MITNISKFLKIIRGLGYVIRWSVYPRSRQETVAEHSFYTALFTYLLASSKGLPERERNELVLQALFHDIEECITSDAPALIKKHVSGWGKAAAESIEYMGCPSEIAALWAGAQTSAIVKAADKLSALAYAKDEWLSGNRMFASISEHCLYDLRSIGDRDVDMLLDQLGYAGCRGEQFIGLHHSVGK